MMCRISVRFPTEAGGGELSSRRGGGPGWMVVNQSVGNHHDLEHLQGFKIGHGGWYPEDLVLIPILALAPLPETTTPAVCCELIVARRQLGHWTKTTVRRTASTRIGL